MEAHYLSLYLTVGSGECAKTLHAMCDTTIWSEVKSTGSPMQMQKNGRFTVCTLNARKMYMKLVRCTIQWW